MALGFCRLEDIKEYFCIDAQYKVWDKWPKKVTILYYKLEYDDAVDDRRSLPAQSPTCHRIKNTDRHTEEILVEELRRLLNENCQVKRVAIYLSYSPCKDCANKLESFLEKTKQKAVKMSIKIANFYHYSDQETQKGLCSLIKSGVQLSVFSGKEDWIQFYNDVTRNDPPKQDIPGNYRYKRIRKMREEDDATILKRLEMKARD